MRSLKLVTATALLFTPSLGLAQDGSARVGIKQKAWMTSNFRSGLTCSATPGGSAVSFSGTGSFDASDDGGVDISVATGADGLPTITAHAIKTKGAGANDRGMAPQSCPTGDASSGGSAVACSVSGDVQSPTVHFTVPLSAFGDGSTAKNYVGHVTLIKQRTDSALWLSKRGYDYYKAHSDLSSAHANANPMFTKLMTCDSSALTAKGGKPMIATYDLVMQKK